MSSSSATADAQVGSRKSSLEDDGDAGAQLAADVEVAGLLAAVRSSLAEPDLDDHADHDRRDQVTLGDHMDLAGLTISDKNEAATSASNSVQASPAIAPSSSDTTSASKAALSNLPPVELKDGGNATIDSAAASSSSGVKHDFFDVRVAIVGNVDSGQSSR
jgi:hypothetical protein